MSVTVTARCLDGVRQKSMLDEIQKNNRVGDEEDWPRQDQVVLSAVCSIVRTLWALLLTINEVRPTARQYCDYQNPENDDT